LQARPLALLLVLTSLVAHPASARADGDPASDVLLAQDVFYSYQPKVSRALEGALEKALHAASAGGLHLKVAIIDAPEELGLVPNLFEHPQAYAQFLDREISFNRRQSLLVVMPAGFGLALAGPPTALSGVPVDRTHSSYGLTRSAILAVIALMRARGHPIATPAIPPYATRSGGPSALLVFALPGALLVLGGLGAVAARKARLARQRPERDPG
jgi:hypothetical protein